MDSSLIPTYQIFKTELEQLEKESELSVVADEQRYKDLPLDALYTSFEDLENIFSHPQVDGTWVDLGGGSGRSCLIYSLLTGKPSINLEIDEARASVGHTLGEKYRLNFLSLNIDLGQGEIPYGDTYFLYFPTGPTLDRILWILSARVGFTLVIIESHGDLFDRVIKERGYDEISRIPLRTPRHNPQALILKKFSIEPSPYPHTLSFQDKLLVIKDGQGEWVADSQGLEWLGQDSYHFLFPPRTISWSEDFVRVLEEDEESYSHLAKISQLRKRGEVRISTVAGHEYSGLIRKIRLSPFLALEISTSELIEWGDIKKITQGSSLCYESPSCFFSLPAL